MKLYSYHCTQGTRVYDYFETETETGPSVGVREPSHTHKRKCRSEYNVITPRKMVHMIYNKAMLRVASLTPSQFKHKGIPTYNRPLTYDTLQYNKKQVLDQ